MDFGALPPEVNSLRTYSGPGSAPMLAAATARAALGAELRSTADSYEAMIAGLTSEEWMGPGIGIDGGRSFSLCDLDESHRGTG